MSQPLIFALSLGAGFFGGVLYEPFSLLGKRGGVLQVVCDSAFFLLFSVFCVGVSVFFAFPEYRWYMYLGNGAGLILYLKSIHKALAFLEKMCYNSLTKARKGLKKQKITTKRNKNIR